MKQTNEGWVRGWAAALLLGWCTVATGAVPDPRDPKDDNVAREASGEDLWAKGRNECKPLSAGDNTKLGIIRQMLQGGKPHAAIAYLDAAVIKAPQADLLRADGLRKTGRQGESDRIYRQLTGSCVAGYAYQGLGLNASEQGRLAEALKYLRAASAALPIDAAIRNDYGYALMSNGDAEAALHEFLTAIELAPTHSRAAHNLILLLARSGDKEKTEAFAERFGISAEELAALRELAARPLAQGAPPALPEEARINVVAVPDAAAPETEGNP